MSRILLANWKDKYKHERKELKPVEETGMDT